MSMKSTRDAAVVGEPSRLPVMRAEYRIIKQENEKLENEINQLRAENDRIVKELAAGISGTESLEKALNDAKMLAGLVAVTGPGIVVTLSDSPKLPATERRPEVINNYLVHDYDVREVCNILFTAGAEAVSVDDQRLIATSSIRCAGEVCLVNTVQLTSPFVIKAIGKPDDLKSALETPGIPIEGLFLLDMISIKKEDSVKIPAFKGSTRFNYAKPVPEIEKED